jgi:SAM-dependent methyltransferase
MDDRTRGFYNGLAESYHLLFQDWEESIQRQAAVLGPLIEGEMTAGRLRMLDCACGIGTQTLGLAQRGHTLVGVDVSERAVFRARREAAQRGLSIEFEVADMRDLSALTASEFDVVLGADNAIPHLLNERDRLRAVEEMSGKLRRGGLFLASIRDYDQIIEQHPATPTPAFFRDGAYRRIYHQVWDWTSDRQCTVHLYITQEDEAGWKCQHLVSVYRAVLREELSALAEKAGLVELRWLMPADSGFYQPLLLARKGNA